MSRWVLGSVCFAMASMAHGQDETEHLPPAEVVRGGADSLEWPSVGPGWRVWTEYVAGEGDALCVAPWGATEPERLRQGARIVETDLAVATDGTVLVVWSEVEGADRDGPSGAVWGVRRAASGTWGEPTRLAGPHALAPTILADATRVVVAWQQWVAREDDAARGRDEVWCAVWAEDGVADRRVVSRPEGHDGEPELSGSPDGALYLAWTHTDGEDVEIHGVRLAPDGTQGAVQSLSADPSRDQRHPALTPRLGGGVWLAWDEIRDGLRGLSYAGVPRSQRSRRGGFLRVVGWDADGVHGLAFDEAASGSGQPSKGELLPLSGGRPVLSTTASGAPTIVYRGWWGDRVGSGETEADGKKSHAYPLLTQTATPDGWSAPRALAEADGPHEEADVTRRGEETWVAWRGDERQRSGGGPLPTRRDQEARARLAALGLFLQGDLGPYRIGLTQIPDVQGEPPSLTTRRDSIERPRLSALDLSRPDVRGDARRTLTHGETTYGVWWGNLHRHTSFSRCSSGREEDPRDRYAMGRDLYRVDFVTMTDHAGQMSPGQWWTHVKLVDLYARPDFCPLQGYEWGTRRTGHMNVIHRGTPSTIYTILTDEGRDGDALWSQLEAGEAITIPHHTAHANYPYDWSKFDARFLRLVELFQSARGSYEFPGAFRVAPGQLLSKGFVQEALNRGYRLGFVASSDHGSGVAYTAVLAERLERGAIFDALRERRTFASTTKGMFIDFRVEGVLMGGLVRGAGPFTCSLIVEGTRPLVEVVVFRNGEVVWSRGHEKELPSTNQLGSAREKPTLSPTLETHRLQETWDDAGPPGGRGWYYARAIQDDAEIVWSSPVFITRSR